MALNFKKILISVLLTLCLFIFVAPSALAAVDGNGNGDKTLWEQLKPPGTITGMREPPALVIVDIFTWIMGFIGAIAIAFIVYGAIIYITSAGNEKRVEQAKRILLFAIVGFVIAILAVVIVQVVGRVVAAYPCEKIDGWSCVPGKDGDNSTCDPVGGDNCSIGGVACKTGTPAECGNKHCCGEGDLWCCQK